MAQWDNYSTKSAPEDNDTLMIKDNTATGKPNKRILFGGLWNWMVTKMTNAVIANLTTTPKTVVGGLNALQSATDTLNSNLAKYRITYNATYSVSGLVYNSPSISQALDVIAAKGVGRYFVEVLSSVSYSDSYNSLTSSNLTMIVDVVSTSYINVFAVTVGNSYGVTLYRAKSSSWGNWIKQPIRDEIDTLNNRLVVSLTRYYVDTAGTTFTIPNNYRGTLVVSDSNPSRFGEYILGSTGAGVVAYKAVLEAADITITTGTNTLTITVSVGSSAILFTTIQGAVPTV